MSTLPIYASVVSLSLYLSLWLSVHQRSLAQVSHWLKSCSLVSLAHVSPLVSQAIRQRSVPHGCLQQVFTHFHRVLRWFWLSKRGVQQVFENLWKSTCSHFTLVFYGGSGSPMGACSRCSLISIVFCGRSGSPIGVCSGCLKISGNLISVIYIHVLQ